MMSIPKPRVTIVGLGLIGGSIGLALREAEATSTIVGHDKEREANNEAKKLGAVDRTEWNLISACEGSDLIILATPLGAIEPTLKAIAPYLKPGCVVLDTASVKEPVLAWAADILPEPVQFIGGNPVVGATSEKQSGLAGARADLFRNGLFCLIPSKTADEHAVQMAANLVAVLGAKPMFIDPVEHDGLVAGMDQLPALVALALLEMAADQPTWRELRKVAGASFETATRLVAADPSMYADLTASNRDNLVRWIDTFSASLASLRQALQEEDSDVLLERVEAALKNRGEWLRDRATGQFDEGLRQELPERPSLVDAFLGGFWRRGARKKES
jgi:prephenate dehydrogenase